MKTFVSKFRRHFMVAAAVFVLFGTASAAQAPEIKRRYDNSTRISKLHPYMQPKVQAIISDLESHGEKPVVHGDVYRTPARQAQLKAQKRSTVSYSFHNVTDRDKSGKGVPASMAADIISYYEGYNVSNSFWMKLASSAQSHDLTSGIYWGLSETKREQIRQYIQSKSFGLPISRGWDAAHVEPRSQVLTLGLAKKGKRPPVPRGYERRGVDF